MKKVLAVVFALIFALSAATAAFAVSNQCPHCGTVVEKEADYNAHLAKTCPVLHPIQECPYEGCTAVFQDPEQYELHINETCNFKPKPTIIDKIVDAVKNIDVKELMNTLNEKVFSKIDFEGILVKVIDILEKGITGIIGAVK